MGGRRRNNGGGNCTRGLGKLLLLAFPLIGAGHAPPCIPFVPPSNAQFLLFALLQVPSAPQLLVPSPLLSSLAKLQDA